MNLDHLGISPSWLGSVPTTATYPTRLNPQAKSLWPAALGKITSRNPRAAWLQAIEELYSLALKKNVNIYIDRSSSNDKILIELIHARRQVVNFLNKHRVVPQLKFRTTKRSVEMKRGGFLLTVDSRVEEVDPELFAKLGLRRASGRREIRLSNNVVFFVYNEGTSMSQRWHVGYEVFIDQIPFLAGNPKPTSRDMEEFIIKMYLPVVRSYRAVGNFSTF